MSVVALSFFSPASKCRKIYRPRSHKSRTRYVQIRRKDDSDQDIVGDVVNLSDPFPEDFAELFYEPKDIFSHPPPVEPFRFNVPSYVVIDSNSGDIFVADQNNRRMHRYIPKVILSQCVGVR